MPYSGPQDDKLPDHVKDLPEDARSAWVGAWNGSYEQCQKEGGEDCEGRAFAVANDTLEQSQAGDMAAGFLFIDLQETNLTPGKPFAGFAAGKFIDLYGRKVELKAKDIAEFVANTLTLIAQHKERKMPGLPIDEERHNKGRAAGWITGAEPGEVTDSKGERIPVINLLAEWTKLGVQLITDKIMTNFSPTIDLTNKIIRGGSLTNWPATVDENGIPLFSAVELAQGVRALVSNAGGISPEPADLSDAGDRIDSIVEETMADEKTQTPDPGTDGPPAQPAPAPAAVPTAELNSAVLMELFKKVPEAGQLEPQKLADLVQKLASRQTEIELEHILAQRERNWQITELAAKLTGGGVRGLPVTIPEMTDFLLSLDDTQYEKAKGIFTKITENGLVDYRELGHGRRLLGKRQVPAEYQEHLRNALKAGYSVAEFFANAELGSPADYDLSQFEGGK